MTGLSPFNRENGVFVLGGDDMLAAWGAITVAPHIVFGWNGRTIAALKGERPNDDFLNEAKVKFREEIGKYDNNIEEPINLAPPELAEQLLNLYYSGYGNLAQKLLNDCWPPNRKGKKQYWDFIITEAEKSPVWKYVEAIQL